MKQYNKIDNINVDSMVVVQKIDGVEISREPQFHFIEVIRFLTQ